MMLKDPVRRNALLLWSGAASHPMLILTGGGKVTAGHAVEGYRLWAFINNIFALTFSTGFMNLKISITSPLSFN